MRYGHGPHGIIAITMKPSALKKWAYSRHTCSLIVHDLTYMLESHKVTEVTTHKEEKPSRIRSDEEDTEKMSDRVISSASDNHWQNWAREGECAKCG